MLALPVFLFIFSAVSVVAASNSSVVCIAGQCLQGTSNTTLGVTLSADGESTSLLLLPGQYSATTNPQLLHSMLTSKSASLSPSPGFENSSKSLSLPLNVALSSGMAIYSESLYSGSAGFTALPSTPASNSTTSLSAASLSLSSSVWAAINVGDQRVVFWDSVPDFGQLPLSGSLALADLQSSACSPSCSSSGVCSTAGNCTCPTGFTGESCESCASGFFGSNCQACPSNCTKCDEGISGTGRCLVTQVFNAPSTCNCINGECGSNGVCTCTEGFTTASNGIACAKCATGFFLTSTGDCKACQLGCSACADSTGVCLTCKTGFTQDGNDKTKCDAPQSTTSSGTVCPDGSFSSGTNCTTCSSACQKCTGATSNDCTLCATGSYTFNGSCVSASSTGVCEGTNLIADNNKHVCDACGAKCTSCEIQNFSVASTVDELKCTGCIPGSFLSNGQCIDSCPTGTFVSPKDNVTCTNCDSSCSTCSGSSTFCLTCPNNQLASDGSCVSSCPSGTFSSSGSCLTCHPDCATCSGSSFNQCSTCPSNRPVLNNGRCLPTCSKSQYFDSTSSSCVSCHSTCSTCSGPNENECLSCSSSDQYLRSGTCVNANCTSSTSIVSGLGVCLSDLVLVTSSTSSSGSPVPSITGLSDPTVVRSTTNKLTWWQILLMALGCAFIFLVIVYCWRRRARKQRAKQTALFASAKKLDRSSNWRWRLVRFGEKLFGHRRSHRAQRSDEEIKLVQLRDAEEARHHDEINKLIGSYAYPTHDISRKTSSSAVRSRNPSRAGHRTPDDSGRLSGPSIYSQVTGTPRRTPEVRQPVKKDQMARFSASTFSNSLNSRDRDLLPPPSRSDAQAYAHAVRADSPSDRLKPNYTGGSRNPFWN
ncbi:growth factor receptor domain-containing protein [Armillaria solidipes]|uniref:Growth factor receptor domain-containing protein n=1 Tax=Armillaria solidipes TaxID=1076256 RepID=A0A2H3C3G7_9AGAR|nr:growth factor receptor domain-containing protein [Armillaria solidipes]